MWWLVGLFCGFVGWCNAGFGGLIFWVGMVGFSCFVVLMVGCVWGLLFFECCGFGVLWVGLVWVVLGGF